MIKVGITIEGSNGLTWDLWQRMAKRVEDCGFYGFYRSDHFAGDQPPDKASLELWVSLTWLADHTSSIEFGPMVSPVSFRHPTITAKMASAVDDLSGGRLLLGIGAGGWEREHNMFGWELLSVAERIKKFEEGVEVIDKLLENDHPTSFEGEYYRLQEAILLPRPSRPGGPRRLIGGLGKKHTLPLAARYAHEWNSVYLTPERFIQYNALFDEMVENEHRKKEDVTRSVLTACIYGNTKAEIKRKYEAFVPKGLSDEQHAAVICGNSAQIVDQISKLEEAGVQKVMLVWFGFDDLDNLEKMGKEILPQLQ